MKKALVFKKEYNGRQIGEIERIVEADKVPSIFLLSLDICEVVDVEDGADEEFLKVVAHDAIIGIGEKWTKDGEEDASQQPMIDDGSGNMIADSSWTYVPEVIGVPAYKKVETDTSAKNAYLAGAAQRQVVKAVQDAVNFGSKLIQEFTVENVMLGITADGMTKTVRTNMIEVLSALQTGSLYDAIDEAKTIPVESKDAKYITDARLLDFVNRIETYLEISLSSDLS